MNKIMKAIKNGKKAIKNGIIYGLIGVASMGSVGTTVASAMPVAESKLEQTVLSESGIRKEAKQYLHDLSSLKLNRTDRYVVNIAKEMLENRYKDGYMYEFHEQDMGGYNIGVITMAKEIRIEPFASYPSDKYDIVFRKDTPKGLSPRFEIRKKGSSKVIASGATSNRYQYKRNEDLKKQGGMIASDVVRIYIGPNEMQMHYFGNEEIQSKPLLKRISAGWNKTTHVTYASYNGGIYAETTKLSSPSRNMEHCVQVGEKITKYQNTGRTEIAR